MPSGLANAYDSVYVIAEGLKIAGAFDRTKLRDALFKVNCRGVVAKYSPAFIKGNQERMDGITTDYYQDAGLPQRYSAAAGANSFAKKSVDLEGGHRERRRRVMQEVLQYLLTGLSVGSVYAMVGIGFYIMWSAAKAVNFYFGDIYVIGPVLTMRADETERAVAGGGADSNHWRYPR